MHGGLNSFFQFFARWSRNSITKKKKKMKQKCLNRSWEYFYLFFHEFQRRLAEYSCDSVWIPVCIQFPLQKQNIWIVKIIQREKGPRLIEREAKRLKKATVVQVCARIHCKSSESERHFKIQTIYILRNYSFNETTLYETHTHTHTHTSAASFTFERISTKQSFYILSVLLVARHFFRLSFLIALFLFIYLLVHLWLQVEAGDGEARNLSFIKFAFQFLSTFS